MTQLITREMIERQVTDKLSPGKWLVWRLGCNYGTIVAIEVSKPLAVGYFAYKLDGGSWFERDLIWHDTLRDAVAAYSDGAHPELAELAEMCRAYMTGELSLKLGTRLGKLLLTVGRAVRDSKSELARVVGWTCCRHALRDGKVVTAARMIGSSPTGAFLTINNVSVYYKANSDERNE